MDITSISNNVLGEASQAMDCGVYLVQSVRCQTVPNSGVLVGNAALRAVCIVRWWRIMPSFKFMAVILWMLVCKSEVG